MIKTILLTLVILLLPFGVVAQNAEVITSKNVSSSPVVEDAGYLYRIHKDGKVGYINIKGEVVINPQFDDGDSFREDLAAIKQGSSWGFIDRTGRVVISPQFEATFDFSDGLAAVRLNGKWGFIDKTGQLVIKAQYKVAIRFSEGLAWVTFSNDKAAYIDHKGQVIIPLPDPILRLSFSEGLAPTSKEVAGKTQRSYMDTTGKIVLTPSFSNDGLLSFQEGLAPILVNNRWGFIDKKGNMVIAPQYGGFPTGFSEGLACVLLNDKVVYIDKKGKVVIDLGQALGSDFSEGIAKIKVGAKYGYIDKTGKIIIPAQYFEAQSFYKGLAVVEVQGKQGYIDKTGYFVWQPTR